jgi:hypothetical protein
VVDDFNDVSTNEHPPFPKLPSSLNNNFLELPMVVQRSTSAFKKLLSAAPPCC